MSVARWSTVASLALAPAVLADVPPCAENFAAVSLGAAAAAVWIALASLPLSGACGERDARFAAAFALPTLALGAAADWSAAKEPAAVALDLLAAWLLSSALAWAALRAAGGALHRVAWWGIVALPTALAFALSLGSGAEAPAWTRQWASFSPLARALDGLPLASAHAPLELWRPLVGAALVLACAWRRAPAQEASR